MAREANQAFTEARFQPGANQPRALAVQGWHTSGKAAQDEREHVHQFAQRFEFDNNH